MPIHRIVSIFAAALFVASASAAESAPLSWNAVDQELGRLGVTQPDGVRRYSFPRSDLNMHVEGHGDPVRLAHALRSALAVSRTPLRMAAPAAQPPIALDTAGLDS